ncbi:hypothetical protein N1030_17340 [Desulfovibrio mangrovi]|uniref:hypothetical protein n=1 Tax=Desulfovibrio mangrovi TaxID=2976983 RepID=UPI002247CC93|nr:hypothetical protein [Desulfovibrio mangrovi]UZP67338.1 hypothetical protein N1030_17340 [Desulfovibrio mangrovi]
MHRSASRCDSLPPQQTTFGRPGAQPAWPFTELERGGERDFERPHDESHRHPTGMPVHAAVPVFVGLQAIGKAVGAGPQTIKRWIREDAFPARRCSDGIYRASAESILEWFRPPYPGIPDSQLAKGVRKDNAQTGPGKSSGSTPQAGGSRRLH